MQGWLGVVESDAILDGDGTLGGRNVPFLEKSVFDSREKKKKSRGLKVRDNSANTKKKT